MEITSVNESCCNMTTNEKSTPSSEVLHSLWMSNSSPSFHGPASVFNFEETSKERPFFSQIDKEETSNDDYDSCLHQPEKKRRLLPNQVHFLEKSFEVDNKLEPERKVQLAKELGLQPRQIAIWFQNRRARYKTKQLEKDYDVLKASFDKLKDDYDTLFKENESLRHEVHLMTEKLHRREKGKEKNSEQSEPTSSPIVDEKEAQKTSTPPIVANVPKIVCKQEDASSAKSDVIDSDSPHYTDGNHSTSYLEQDPTTSDFSQDEDDNLSKSFLCFPEIGDQVQPSSCNLSFQIEDQPCWFWQY